MKDRLWLHHELFEIVDALAANAMGKPDFEERDILDPFILYGALLSRATVFDCRQLPVAFVMDTGDAVIADSPEARGPVRLPFQHCYFEFAGLKAILATVPEEVVDGDDNDRPIEVFAKPVHAAVFSSGDAFLSTAQFLNEADHPLYELLEDDPVCREPADIGARLLLGVLALLKERLVIGAFKPDPSPFISKARKKKGKRPLSGPTHVLTVNVPAVRRAAEQSPIPMRGSHESPCLHWRRGHWRVLHRYSEFESRTWIHRCLVGDPDKGFVKTQYRLTNEIPMLPSEEPVLGDAL